jgi:hypothetical protein
MNLGTGLKIHSRLGNSLHYSVCARGDVIKTNDNTKYVELSVEGFWTRVRFPPPPPLIQERNCLWFFFCCAGAQCWRATRDLARGHQSGIHAGLWGGGSSNLLRSREELGMKMN